MKAVAILSLFYVCSKQDLVVSAPFYHAPMSSGAVYIYSGQQVYEQLSGLVLSANVPLLMLLLLSSLFQFLQHFVKFAAVRHILCVP